jgi:hypothetical protein
MQSKVKYFLPLVSFPLILYNYDDKNKLENMKLKQKILAEQSVGWGIMFWH